MTPTEEAEFTALREQGLDNAEIAARLGIPVGTVASRASTLIRQGKRAPRPGTMAHPHQSSRSTPMRWSS